jgi:hypothetical protein
MIQGAQTGIKSVAVGADTFSKENIMRTRPDTASRVHCRQSLPRPLLCGLLLGLCVLAASWHVARAAPAPSLAPPTAPLPGTGQAARYPDNRHMAMLYRQGLAHFMAGRHEQAFAVWWPLADMGHPGAQYFLGLLLGHEGFQAHNPALAVGWLRKAAIQDHAPAQLSLGIAYANGNGVARDLEQAIFWWRRAAANGNVDAQYNLGQVYHHGMGVSMNATEALHWWTLAARQGDAMAQYYLGVAYANGQGVAVDLRKAVKWWTQAASRGNAHARTALEALGRSLTD